MSTRPFQEPHSVVTNSDMSASIISDVTILKQKTGAGYDIAWTGAPVGSFSVQISNTYSLDAGGNVSNAGSWTPVLLVGSVLPSGSPDNGYINLAGLEAYAVRLVYTRTSGTGTLNAVICSKVQ
jgi:hypothetical protein